MHFASNESAKISDWIIRDQLSALHLAASSSRHTACCHLRLQMRCSGNRATCQSFSAPNCVPLANALAPASVSVNHSQTSLVQKKYRKNQLLIQSQKLGYANSKVCTPKVITLGLFFLETNSAQHRHKLHGPNDLRHRRNSTKQQSQGLAKENRLKPKITSMLQYF